MDRLLATGVYLILVLLPFAALEAITGLRFGWLGGYVGATLIFWRHPSARPWSGQ